LFLLTVACELNADDDGKKSAGNPSSACTQKVPLTATIANKTNAAGWGPPIQVSVNAYAINDASQPSQAVLLGNAQIDPGSAFSLDVQLCPKGLFRVEAEAVDGSRTITTGTCELQNATASEFRADIQGVGADDHLAVICYGW